MVASLNPPGQPAGDALVAHFGREAPELSIVLTLDRVQGQPRGGACEPVRARPGRAVNKDSGEHRFADPQADGVTGAASGPFPRLDADRSGPRVDDMDIAFVPELCEDGLQRCGVEPVGCIDRHGDGGHGALAPGLTRRVGQCGASGSAPSAEAD